jgi:hypothetical protein
MMAEVLEALDQRLAVLYARLEDRVSDLELEQELMEASNMAPLGVRDFCGSMRPRPNCLAALAFALYIEIQPMANSSRIHRRMPQHIDQRTARRRRCAFSGRC